MAFTEAQKVKCRVYLGYPDTYQDNNTRLESAFDVIGERADTKALVETVLASLATVETSLSSAVSTAGLKSVGRGAVEWFGESSAQTSTRDEGRALCGRLSIIFGVPLAGDAFGTGGYQGDKWMGAGWQYGSGEILLG